MTRKQAMNSGVFGMKGGDGTLRVDRFFAHNLVYFTTGVEKLLLAVDPSGRGDVTDTHIVWKNRKGAPEIPVAAYCG